jgi:RNA polymerase sigma-70 factor (ECF subfamily)
MSFNNGIKRRPGRDRGDVCYIAIKLKFQPLECYFIQADMFAYFLHGRDPGRSQAYAACENPDIPLWCKISSMDEPGLIHEAQHGDLNAFNSLVLAYQDIVYNTALRILGDEDLAADASQDAFISSFRAINSYRGGSFRAWLLRTVTNACYDELRRIKRHPTTPLEPGTDDSEDIETPRWLTDPDPSPEDQLDRLELEHAIQHCLENLPTDFRAVVVLADIQGLDYSEVAVAVKTPLGTVKSRLARARLRLRECLQGFGELLPAAFRLEEERGL